MPLHAPRFPDAIRLPSIAHASLSYKKATSIAPSSNADRNTSCFLSFSFSCVEQVNMMRSTIQFLRISMFTLLALTIVIHTMIPAIPSSVLLNQDVLLFLFDHKVVVLSLLWCATVAYLWTRPLPVVLLDYTCFKPDPNRRCSLEVCEYIGLRSRRFCLRSQEFMRTIHCKSGLGDETYAPPFLFQTDYGAQLQHAIQEAEEGMFSAVTSLLAMTAVDPSRITVLVVACSMFAPTPSFTSLIVHHFKLSPSVKTFNLAGMGCSAGTLSIDLAAKILRRRVGYALIVVTESTSLNWYFGDNRHMLVTNCIFRSGTATALLTSDSSRLGAANMELVRTLRTHHGADDAAYNAAIQMEDEEGNVGVALTKDLVRVAGAGLKTHISTLGPRVLPVSELLRYVYNVARSFMAGDRKAVHVPDFTKAFEHMCIHSGGKAVINAVGKIMRFDNGVTEPARMCLHRFGNTSSSLVFYELAYFEAKGKIKRGDRVWMLAFGTGFKACSAVWRALRDSGMDPDNPWKECIHRYPVV